MDSTRRLVLLALFLVIAKTIDPSLPLMLRYYMLIGWWYARQCYKHILGYTMEHYKTVHKLPKMAMLALAHRLGLPRRRRPLNNLFYNYLYAHLLPVLGMTFNNNRNSNDDDSHNQEDTTMGLVMEIMVELRRRAVSRLPDFVHYTTDRLHSIHQNIISPMYSHYQLIPHHQYLTTALLTGLSMYAVRKTFTRVRNAAEVPLEWYASQKRLRGWCVAVTDSDNIRFYHAPTVFHGPGAQEARSRRLETINVRLAGIDAPEMGHFGGTPQPFSREAKQWLTDTVCNQRVVVTLHRLDQYNRVVASVGYYPKGTVWSVLSVLLWPFTHYTPHSLSLDMVKAGLAMVYENAGAEYGGLKEKLVRAEHLAKQQRIGIWSQESVVHPSEYKKQRHLQQLQAAGVVSVKA